MKLIVLTGKAKSGKTHALELLKKVNEGSGFRKQQIYFQDDVRYESLDDFGLPLLDKIPLGIITTKDRRVSNTVDLRNVFIISKNSFMQTFHINKCLDPEGKLDWTEAFHWLKSNSTEKEKPEIVDEFFNYICK